MNPPLSSLLRLPRTPDLDRGKRRPDPITSTPCPCRCRQRSSSSHRPTSTLPSPDRLVTFPPPEAAARRPYTDAARSRRPRCPRPHFARPRRRRTSPGCRRLHLVVLPRRPASRSVASSPSTTPSLPEPTACTLLLCELLFPPLTTVVAPSPRARLRHLTSPADSRTRPTQRHSRPHRLPRVRARTRASLTCRGLLPLAVLCPGLLLLLPLLHGCCCCLGPPLFVTVCAPAAAAPVRLRPPWPSCPAAATPALGRLRAPVARYAHARCPLSRTRPGWPLGQMTRGPQRPRTI